MPPEQKPRLLVVAGPNGSGKTILTEKLLQDEWALGCTHVNPDNIAREKNGGWFTRENFFEAADEAATIREHCLENHQDLIFETVFSTEEKIDFLIRAQEAGYFIRFFFVSTSHPSINASRITYRYMDGGHEVPISKIVDRYNKSIANSVIACQFVDRAYIYDNSIDGEDPSRIFRTEHGRITRWEPEIPEWAVEIFQALNK